MLIDGIQTIEGEPLSGVYGIPLQKIITLSSTLREASNFGRWKPPVDLVIDKIVVGCGEAPLYGPIRLYIKKNGISITESTIDIETTTTLLRADLLDPGCSVSDSYTFDIVQVGSVGKGSDLTVQIDYTTIDPDLTAPTVVQKNIDWSSPIRKELTIEGAYSARFLALSGDSNFIVVDEKTGTGIRDSHCRFYKKQPDGNYISDFIHGNSGQQMPSINYGGSSVFIPGVDSSPAIYQRNGESRVSNGAHWYDLAQYIFHNDSALTPMQARNNRTSVDSIGKTFAYVDTSHRLIIMKNNFDNTYTELQRIQLPSTSSAAHSVKLSGNGLKLLVGSPATTVNTKTGAGRAFLYSRTTTDGTFTLTNTLDTNAEHTGINYFFGCALAMNYDGTRFAIGQNNPNKGFVYTYDTTLPDNDVQTMSTPVSNTADGNLGYGTSLSMDEYGEILAVSAIKCTNGVGSGGAFIYKRISDNWVVHKELYGTHIDDGENVCLSADGKTVAWTNMTTKKVVIHSTTLANLEPWESPSEMQLVSSDIEAGSYYGISTTISADGNTAIVSAFLQAEPIGAQAGAAFVFIKSNNIWVFQQKITPVSPLAYAQFGYSCSLSADGNTAIIGSHARTDAAHLGNAGGAYIFTRSGNVWSQQAYMTAPSPLAGSWFGFIVDISADGNTALIAEPGRNTETGQAYVWTRSGTSWTYQATLTMNDPTTYSKFGFRLSLSSDGNTAMIGAHTKAGNTGAVYAFTRSGTTWTFRQKLVASDAAASSNFGYSVGVSNNCDSIVISSHSRNSGTGAAYYFTRSGNTWSQQQIIVASDAATGAAFGVSTKLSLDGNTLAVSATGAGKLYIFKNIDNTFIEQSIIRPSISASSNFGAELDISADGQTVAVSDYSYNSNTGRAFIYESV